MKSDNRVQNVWLAKYLVLHKVGREDEGFGCGFRNIQNIVASLVYEPEFRRACGFHCTPNISQIQADIESAWAAGFDPAGAAQLDGRLLGTTKWIGATEAAIFLQVVSIEKIIFVYHLFYF